MTPRRHARLLALAGLALLLFSPPLLLLFDRPAVYGLSWLPLYLFLAWAGVIGVAAWLLERPDSERREEPRRHEK
ncbi:hypothetical protein SAMN02745148_01950 [Modicisalibacter ilicicola DSM 19980]|uniref:DUF3311 domain-containing protein n=1 Tax=Modicisalibacter ilicicola DSM 19980 TaxID=1121942 RepID=A0A1M4ZCN5_9GAMM|nr:hypothetical protein [Halomonas ilicicola]SHF15718.1 hypothetical protein SAMN02745148_01950 [Halomonas ilicicola DSM 19980]